MSALPILELSDGRVIRACKKCKKEVFPRNGRWVAQYPEKSKDLVGWWISQLNSVFVNPGSILRAFTDPETRNLPELYNSKLGMAYIAAENRLTPNDIWANCGQEPMKTMDPGPCAMGVDVGKILTVTVGCKPRDKVFQILYLARVSSFNDLHDIAKRFNVRRAVIDAMPETRAAREFQESEKFPVFLCTYTGSPGSGPRFDEGKRLISVNRTELCDTVHDLVSRGGKLVLPRRCEEMEVFTKELTNIAKVLEEDQESGSREYRYRALGADHYFHSLGYFSLAARDIGISYGSYFQPREIKVESDFDVFESLNSPRGEIKVEF